MLTGRCWRRLGGVSLLLALVGGSAPACSLVYDLSADQCSTAADCAQLGDDYSVCQAGVCVASAAPGGAGSGDPGSGGEAGAAPQAECAENADCIDAHFGQPYLCSSGRCVGLVTDECPLVVGGDNLRVPEPIVFGAYAVAPDGVNRSAITRNLELVISEFTRKVIGLSGGPDGTDRTLAFVVCNSQFPGVAPGTIDAFRPSLRQLVDELHVPGIVAALKSRDLQAVFSQELEKAGTFVISPFEQDSELAALNDDGRLWNMLGTTADLAPTFGPLLLRTETYLRRDESFLNLASPGDKLRLAVVTANIASETDVRDALLELPELDGFEVKPFQVESAELTVAPDVSGVADNLLDYAPHIIVALAGSEFIQGIIPALETGSFWNSRTSGQQRPMYVLGSKMAAETWSTYGSKDGEPGGWSSFFDRVVGVAYASAADRKLLDAYELRMIDASDDLDDPSVVLGLESAYDAAYLMIYAAAAAGEVPTLTGKDLARGMLRLVDGDAYDVGPTAISKILTALDNSQDIGLNLTLGPADWDVAHGTRNGLGSVYCLNNGAFDFETQPGISRGPNNDVLRYDPQTNTLESAPLRCIPNF